MEGHGANNLGDFKIHVNDIPNILAAKFLISQFQHLPLHLLLFTSFSEHAPVISTPTSPPSVLVPLLLNLFWELRPFPHFYLLLFPLSFSFSCFLYLKKAFYGLNYYQFLTIRHLPL